MNTPLIHSKLTTQQIFQLSSQSEFAPFLVKTEHQQEGAVTTVREPQSASKESLVFISTAEHLNWLLPIQPAIIVADHKLPLNAINWPCCVLQTASISASMAILLPFFDDKDSRFPPGVHPTAVIDPTAHIGQQVRIGAYSVIGAGVKIGDGTVIGPLCNIETLASLGRGCRLHSHVFVGARCALGDECEMQPFSSVGTDGFGYIQKPNQERLKIPQVGRVILGNRVELGSGSMIDRSTLSATVIGDGTKFDNHCHIAHNCQIGKNGAFAAGFSVAGSSTLGDNCMAGGQVGVADHIRITDSVILGGRSGVTKDIEKPGTYAGFPLEPMRDALRTLASLPSLFQLRKQVAQIQKKLGMDGTAKE